MSKNDRSCLVDGCDRERRTKGYCEKHYYRFHKYGNPEPAELNKRKPKFPECTVHGCGKKHVGRGYCSMHLQRVNKYGTVEKPKKIRNIDLLCDVDGCDNNRCAGSLCAKHYQRQRIHGSPTALKQKTEPKWHTTKDGYICKHLPDDPNANSSGTVLQHRLVMSEHIGRPLYPHENVHHIDGDRANNNINNLELWSISQPSGQRVQDKVLHAINFLKEELGTSLLISKQDDLIIREVLSLVTDLSVQCGSYARCDSAAFNDPPGEMHGEYRRKASY